MSKHILYDYVKKVIDSDLTVLLTGPAGSGKSTIAMNIAEDLNLTLYTQNCTKQTTVNQLLGFISINGSYIPSQLRQAFENGGLFLLDEIDAADPNVLLCLNTIENGFISFPDKIVYKHSDFRLIATANPQEEHNIYTGRSNLDFSTRNRFYEIPVERDHNLELQLTDSVSSGKADLAREILRQNGSSIQITMRDVLRYHKLEQVFPNSNQDSMFFKNELSLYDDYKNKLYCEVQFPEKPIEVEEINDDDVVIPETFTVNDEEFNVPEEMYLKDIIKKVGEQTW